MVSKQGSGSKPGKGQKIRANYRLTLLSGQLIDASGKHGGPIEFNVGTGQVIPGRDEMLLDMRPGEKRTLVVPPEPGYGEDGAVRIVIKTTFTLGHVEYLYPFLLRGGHHF